MMPVSQVSPGFMFLIVFGLNGLQAHQMPANPCAHSQQDEEYP